MLDWTYAAADAAKELLLIVFYITCLFIFPAMFFCPFFAFASQCSFKTAFKSVCRIQAICFLISLWLYLFLHSYAPQIVNPVVSQVVFQVSILFPISCIIYVSKAKPKGALRLLVLIVGNGILALIFTVLGLMVSKIF